jgi:hypothetical protein
MTILIANIGTSDLAVKVDDYYIPIGFDRNEPNIDESELNDDEKIAWDRELRDSFITTDICPKLNVEVKENDRGYRSFSFRELTKKLKEAYISNPDEWHNKIKPARIGGVINTGIDKFDINKLYLFITDQDDFILDPKTKEKKFNKGFLTDTIHIYEILKLWLEKEKPELKIIPNIIPKNILPVEQDKLLNYYYKFFIKNEIKNEDIILVSSKGGTGQMQTALKVQALASYNQFQLFIDPILSIKKLLSGEISECIFTSYWEYTKAQRYDDVKTILENRWDFDGAIDILKKWKKLLDFLANNLQQETIKTNQVLISNIIKDLEIASNCFKLDIESATQIWQKNGKDNEQLIKQLCPDLIKQLKNNKYSPILNLYSQCKVYDYLGQSAYLLSRMASFYDSLLTRIAEKHQCYHEYPSSTNRFKKIDFLTTKIGNKNKKYWKEIVTNLQKLDFWYDKRNDLIHSAKGISQNRLSEVYLHRINDTQRANEYDKKNAQNACNPQEITTVMGEILNSDLNIINAFQKQFIIGDYYIYSSVKDWVIEQLDQDL